MRIGIDAMGGDHAPEAIVRGAVEALSLAKDHELVLVGDEAVIRVEMERFGQDLAGRNGQLQIVHTTEVIGMNDHPVESVRQRKDASLCRLAEMAGRGELDAAISAGNTGAFAAAAKLRLKKMLPGVSRPGIAVVVPTFSGPVVLCDAGVNITPKPQHLVQYALMAAAYSRNVLNVEAPKVGLLSVGEEDLKGTTLVKQSHEMMRDNPRISFVGNVEGRDLFRGTCDVVICDGFVGNIALKLTEGLAEGLFKTIFREIAAASPDLAPAIEPAIQRVWANHDYAEYGGAPMLGVDSVCIICHGSSNHIAIRNAVRVAIEYLERDVNAIITEDLAASPEAARSSE
jgi:glycerol-3-phosphate acyltransferase PlsX